MRLSRAYLFTAEFEARQLAFDFAVVARAVLKITIDGKKKASAMLARFVKSCRQGWTKAAKKPHQLVLELDAIAQIPLFGLSTATDYADL